MRWSDVLADKSLRDLPYKIELNEWGKIEMTPASNRHGRYQSKIARLLEDQLPQGETITECAIDTPLGVKVADVAWCSKAFIDKHGFETPYTEAPEICVEIVSPSNAREEMQAKVRLYLERGAKEVWLVYEDGRAEHFGHDGALRASSFGVKVAF